MMHRTQNHWRKYLKRKKGFTSSVKGVSHLSRRAKRRLYCKLQLWMWRKRREKCHFWILRAKKRACGIKSGSCLGVKSQKNKSKVVSSPGCDTGGSEDTLTRLKQCETVSLSEMFFASRPPQNRVVDTTVSAGNVSMPTPTSQKPETLTQLGEIKDSLRHTVKPLLSRDSDAHGLTTQLKKTRTLAERLEVDAPSGQLTAVPPGQDQPGLRAAVDRITSKKSASSQSDVSPKALTKDIHGRSLFHI